LEDVRRRLTVEDSFDSYNVGLLGVSNPALTDSTLPLNTYMTKFIKELNLRHMIS